MICLCVGRSPPAARHEKLFPRGEGNRIQVFVRPSSTRENSELISKRVSHMTGIFSQEPPILRRLLGRQRLRALPKFELITLLKE
jgi:hypothetical protein